jgi:hypothetical protein
MAGGAVAYKCTGVNRVDRSVVELDISFDTYAQEAGFTNQSITITKVDGSVGQVLGTLQMFGADKKNNCKQTGDGEIYLNPKNGGFEMKDTSQDSAHESLVFINSKCANQKLEIWAACRVDF